MGNNGCIPPTTKKPSRQKTRLIGHFFSSVESIDYRLSILYRVGRFSRLERWKVTLLIWHHSARNSPIVIPTETHQNALKCFFFLEFKRQKRGLKFGQNTLFSLLWSGWILVLMLLVASSQTVRCEKVWGWYHHTHRLQLVPSSLSYKTATQYIQTL